MNERKRDMTSNAMEGQETNMDQQMSGKDFRRKQRGKNLAVALALVAFAVIVYVVSIVRMAGA